MNIDTSTLRFILKDDLCLVGDNPEMADMGNPRGDLEGLAHYIVAETPDGRRFAHNTTAYTINGYVINGNNVYHDDENLTTFCVDSRGVTVARLNALAAYLNANHPSLDADCWTEVQASYGSAAYVSGGWEARNLSQEIGDAVDAGEISAFEADSRRVECGLLS